MGTTTSQMGSFYDEKLAASQLRKYREKGPIASTRALIEALKAEGVEGKTLLDIGGGIGALQHDLLDAGVTHATSVDASAPYLAAAGEEGQRRGHEGPRHLPTRRLRRAGELGAVCMDRHARPSHQRLSELGTTRGTRGRAHRAPFRPRLPARHALREGRHLRHESHAAPAEKASARVHPTR